MNVDGFDYYGLNRVDVNKRAVRGSWGVGILVKRALKKQYVIELNRDNILRIKLVELDSLVIYSVCPQ